MADDGPESLDTSLLARAQQGDTSAFEALVERHRDNVYGLVLRMTRSDADAAEVVQETFLSAYQHLGEFRGDAAFGSWVHRIAANHALMRLRHRKVVEANEAPEEPTFDARGHRVEVAAIDWSRRADEQVLDEELGRAIQQATDRLPEEYRRVFLLKDVDGLSYEEIADLTGDSVAAIKSRLHRARLGLREAIGAFYNSPAKPA